MNGGMEKYVWYLCHELAKAGISVGVICEQIDTHPVNDLEIHIVPRVSAKHRWEQLSNFSYAVDELVRDLSASAYDTIFHSHERSLNHHVTTFHGPPFTPQGIEKLLLRNSRRHKTWKEMERRELFGPNVRQITTVSKNLKNQLF